MTKQEQGSGTAGLTAIGALAHDLGAAPVISAAPNTALAYCAEHLDQMNPAQLRIYDEVRADDNETRLENFAMDLASLTNHGFRLIRRCDLASIAPAQATRVANYPGSWAVFDDAEGMGGDADGFCIVGDDPAALARDAIEHVDPAESLQPYTVLFMLPDWKRGDQPHESDHICRVWATAAGPEMAIKNARLKIPADIGLSDDDIADLDDYSPVAVYAGHIVDLYCA